MSTKENSNFLEGKTQRAYFTIAPELIDFLINSYQERSFDEDIKEIKKITEDKLESSLQTDFINGLSSDSYFDERIEIFGKNKISEEANYTFFRICLDTVKGKYMIFLQLLALTILIFGITNFGSNNSNNGWIEGFVMILEIYIIVFIKGIVGMILFNKDSKLIHTQITTMRDGKIQKTSPDKLVVGDKIYLKKGDIVPLNSLIIESNSLLCEESSTSSTPQYLSKETLKTCLTFRKNFIKSLKSDPTQPKTKFTLPSPLILKNSTIAKGSAWAITLSTTQTLSPIQKHEKKDLKLPFESNLDKFKSKEFKIVFAAAIILLLALYLRFFIRLSLGKYQWEGLKSISEVIGYFISSISLLEVVLPELIPSSLSIVLAYSVIMMKKEKQIVLNLDVCDKISVLDCVCVDDIGVLTENRPGFEVLMCWGPGGLVEMLGKEKALKVFEKNLEFCRLVKQAVEFNCRDWPGDEEGQGQGQGNDGNFFDQALNAVRIVVEAAFVEGEEIRDSGGLIEDKVVKVNEFCFGRMKSSVILRTEKGFRVFVIGADHTLIKSCNKYLSLNMKTQKLTDDDIEKLESFHNQISSKGLKTICIAKRDFTDKKMVESLDINNFPMIENTKLTIIALIGLSDPLRPYLSESLIDLKRGKINIKMLSKFNSITAESIARQAGLTDSSERLIEGAKLFQLIGGVMCEKCNDKNFIKTPQDTKDSPTIDYTLNPCECPSYGENARKDVIINFNKFKEIIDDIDVISNCAPIHKYALLVGLQQMGYKVGITGSNYEDAKILRKADVGFSISKSCVYTRQLSDIMLHDESLASIVRVILWGRSMYASIKRTIQFELTANLVVVLTNIIGQITIQQECISDSQVLWMEMIVSSIGILAFVTEEPNYEVVDKIPEYFRDYIVNAAMFRNIIAQTFVQVSLLMIFVFEGEYRVLGC